MRFGSGRNLSSLERPNQSMSLSDFQSIVSTRRTAQKFLPLSAYPKTRDPNGEWIIQATTRAIQCAVTAPCHHRTEPTTFVRIKSTSTTAKNLLDVLYEVTFRKQLKILKERSSSSSLSSHEHVAMTMDMVMSEAQNLANKKKQKWNDSVCMYIIVLVQGQPSQVDMPCEMRLSNHDDEESIYAVLPYRPPQTERQVEDVS